MGGFLDKLFGRSDKKREMFLRIMEDAENNDHEFMIYRRITFACYMAIAEIGNQAKQKIKTRLSELKRAMSVGNVGNLTNVEFEVSEIADRCDNEIADVLKFMKGELSANELSYNAHNKILESLGVMKAQDVVATMFSEKSIEINRLVKSGHIKAVEISKKHGLSEFMDQL